ncbi:LysR family transcriptional regulator [Rhizobium sp. SL86]|uniref:LysR family transcriptional regulator n=1 Tax=Rhizobium sp. SL86 TaxID=2995148 RepID=UPI00227563F8|nr:LysR family transcriptional regulator [Rhizobium sp. SL86]MCY1667523.1 LysR family transcriptional regulator [Rhizobium sp. SL86]
MNPNPIQLFCRSNRNLLSIRMEPRQLQYFRVIAEEEHFGRASSRLQIAQPALSRQMKLLEDEIGVALFERLPRGIRLTTAGRVFLDHCREISSSMTRAVTATRATALGSIGILKVGFIEVAAWQGIVPDSIRRFRDRFPAIELSLSAMSSARQLQSVQDGKIDAGFVYNAHADRDLVALPLARHSVLLALPAGHPLAEQPDISLADLRDEGFIGFRRQASTRYFDDLAQAFAKAGFEPHILQELDSEPDMLALVNAGAGLAFVNACQQWRPPPGISFRQVHDLAVDLELSLVHRANNGAPALRHLVLIVQEEIGKT